MSSLVKWSIVGVVVVGVLTGAAYHHATGARFEARLTLTSRPPLPSTCNAACTKVWNAGTWYRATLKNSGHRGSYALCTVTAYSASGEQVFSNVEPGQVVRIGSAATGPYVQAGQIYSWAGSLPVGGTAPARRFSGSCRSVDYSGNEPG